ncbi:hypothetical protein P175DRAFT_096469 [Aspergillus ochraceoroseus IBT 24754]|uniref:Uncharacterized protein n=1 Tax=Aspergillus ochraceoroseus IBT 24754 TaxID=1392256 RepID=A0A2T5LMR1_9EURO|nr:uncharacterized protein P175DRAFT_096469 [Aspergillus ochraceoroseus IBT 24754]PTU17578.1 hypothetical protein P175DRAFT_096469 [Aspergillus ochraceoroseus IBT 24754]
MASDCVGEPRTYINSSSCTGRPLRFWIRRHLFWAKESMREKWMVLLPKFQQLLFHFSYRLGWYLPRILLSGFLFLMLDNSYTEYGENSETLGPGLIS